MYQKSNFIFMISYQRLPEYHKVWKRHGWYFRSVKGKGGSKEEEGEQ